MKPNMQSLLDELSSDIFNNSSLAQYEQHVYFKEMIKKDISKYIGNLAYSELDLIQKAIEDNQVDLFKKIIDQHPLAHEQLSLIIEKHQNPMFILAMEKYPDLMDYYPQFLAVALEFNNNFVQTYMSEKNEYLRDFVTSSFIYSCKDKNVNDDLKYLLSPHNALSPEINLSDDSDMDGLSYAAQNKDIKTLKKIVQFADIKGIELQNLDRAFIFANNPSEKNDQDFDPFSSNNQTDKIDNEEVIMYFLYDLKVEVSDKMLEVITENNWRSYMEALNKMIEKRDFLFKLEEDLGEKENKRNLKI